MATPADQPSTIHKTSADADDTRFADPLPDAPLTEDLLYKLLTAEIAYQRGDWETGYVATEWVRAGQLHPVISYSTEFIDIWFCRGLTKTEARLDDEEFLEVITMTPQELLDGCRDGTITDSKTMIGAFWLQNVLAGTWNLGWKP